MAAFADAFLRAGDSEQDVAWRFAELAEQLVPAVSPVLLAAYKGHLRENVQRGVLSRAELEAGHLVGEQEAAVCFADMVGFTTLGAEIEAEQLGGVVGRFGELASDAANSQVRLVKTIGDAAMLTSREPVPLVGAALVAARGRSRKPTFPACAPGSPRVRRLRAPATSTATRSTSPAA